MSRTTCSLCRWRQLLLTSRRKLLWSVHPRRPLFTRSRLSFSRQLHTDVPSSKSALHTALDEHIEPELPPAVCAPPDTDLAARIDALLATKHELDAVVLFQRSRHLLPLSTWNAVLAQLIRQPRLLSFLHQLSASPNGQPVLVSAVGQYLVDMSAHSLQPDATTYELCMGVAASAKQWPRVLRCWQEMDAVGSKPTLPVAHRVLQALTETAQPALILSFYSAHFDTSVDDNWSQKHLPSIAPLDTQQPPPLLIPTALTFHYVLSAAVQLRDTGVTQLWKVMKSRLSRTALDVTLHKSYLAYLGSEGKLEHMMREYARMKRRPIQPTLLLLFTLLTALSSRIVALSSPSAGAPTGTAAAQLAPLASSFQTVLDDLYSAHLTAAQQDQNAADESGEQPSDSPRSSSSASLFSPSIYALIITTFSALRDTHRTQRYYQQYCHYCVNVLASSASSSSVPSHSSSSFSASTHSAILHAMLRLYALQGDVALMEGYLGEIVSGGMDGRDTLEVVLLACVRADGMEQVKSTYAKWCGLADGSALPPHVKSELVAYYEQRGQTAALEQLMQDGVLAADVDGYDRLISACCLSGGALDAMWGYHASMTAAHFLPSSATYAQMLRAVRERGTASDRQVALQLLQEVASGRVRLNDDAITDALLIAVQTSADGANNIKVKQQLTKAKANINAPGKCRLEPRHIHAMLAALPAAERVAAWDCARALLNAQAGDSYELMWRTYEELRGKGAITEAKRGWLCRVDWMEMIELRIPPPELPLRGRLARLLSRGEYGRFTTAYQQVMALCEAADAEVSTERIGALQVAALEVLQDKSAAGDASALPFSQFPLLMQAAALVLRSINLDAAATEGQSHPLDFKRLYSSLLSLLTHLRAMLLQHTQHTATSIEPALSMDSRFVRIHVQHEQPKRSAAQPSGKKRGGSPAKSPPVQRSSMRTPQPVDVLAGADAGGQPTVAVYVEHQAALRYVVEQLEGMSSSVQARDGAWQLCADAALLEVRAIRDVL